MAIDSMRISNLLPNVRCSKCSAAISMEQMATHVCGARQPLNSIQESRSPANGYSMEASVPGRQLDRSQRRRPPEKDAYDQNIFSSTQYARNGLIDRDENNSVHLERSAKAHHDTSVHSRETHAKPSVSNANAVLGRLNNLKPGVLDSKSLNRPVQQMRLGPVQTRDPRATMIPIRPDTRGREREPIPVPTVSPLWNHPNMQPHYAEGVPPQLSVRSQTSAGYEVPGTKERLRTPEDGTFPSSLSSNDSGPFHHVSSKLDPARFLPPEDASNTAGNVRKKLGNRSRVHRDVYDDDWEEQGIEHDSIVAERPRSRPPTAVSIGRPREGATAQRNGVVSSYSATPSGPVVRPLVQGQLQGRKRYDEEMYKGERKQVTTHYDQPAVRQRDHHQAAEESFRKAVDTGSRSSTSDAAHREYDANSLPVITRSRAMNTSAYPKREVPSSQIRAHQRHETSSSLGTVLTSATMDSVRSSISSPPTSPPTSELHYRAQNSGFDEATTPRPGHTSSRDGTMDNGDWTPRAMLPAEKPIVPAIHRTNQYMKRSNTNDSFDRLLRDIGSSIDELDVPCAPFAALDNSSPSSNYSPVKASQAPREDICDRLRELPQRLGSPASLRSKETSSSHGSNNHSRTTSRSRNTICRACASPINGRSISSADGKLSGKYHKACFKCSHQDCVQSTFPNGEFYVFDDRPYCSKHYHATAGSACAWCGEGIEGACIATADYRRFHVPCHEASTKPQVAKKQYGAF